MISLALRSLTALIVFITISFGTAYLLDYTIILSQPHTPLSIAVLTLRMMTPLAGVIAALMVEGVKLREGLWRIGVRVGRVEFIVVAVAIPYAALTLSIPLSLAMGISVSSLSELITTIMGQVSKIPLDESLLVFLILVNILFLNTIIGATLNAIIALGEEVGWRGYLLLRLQKHVGFTLAAILSGIVWGLWHAPLIYHLGYNYPGHGGILALLVFTLYTVVVGYTYSILRAVSASLIPPAIAHGVLNANGGLMLLLFTGDRLLAPPAGITASLSYLILALALIVYSIRKGIRLYASEEFEPEKPSIY